MPLETDRAVQRHLDSLDEPGTRDGLTLDASVTESREVAVAVSVNRSWSNGWNLAAYARAWWKGAAVVPEAGVKVRKDF